VHCRKGVKGAADQGSVSWWTPPMRTRTELEAAEEAKRDITDTKAITATIMNRPGERGIMPAPRGFLGMADIPGVDHRATDPRLAEETGRSGGAEATPRYTFTSTWGARRGKK